MQSCADQSTSCAVISGRTPCRCSLPYPQRRRQWRQAPFSSPDARLCRVTCAVSSGTDLVLRRYHQPRRCGPAHMLAVCHRAQVATSSAAAAEAVVNYVLPWRSMSSSEECSVLVVDGQQLVQEACQRHKTSPTASAALGRALLGTLLLATFRGEGETTQVTFQGNGPLGQIQTIAKADGLIKGRVSNPACDLPLREDGKLAVGAAVGAGVLSVVRSEDSQYTAPYTGMIPIRSGEIAEDFAMYLADSEQTNSAVGLGVAIGTDLSVLAAGGFLVNVLPNASEETLAQLEANLASLPPISQLLQDGDSPADITARILGPLGVREESATSITPRFGPCEPESLKERMKRAVALLGKDEVDDIVRSQGKIEVECEFCKEQYQFTEQEIMEVLGR